MNWFNNVGNFFAEQVAPAVQGAVEHIGQHAGPVIHGTIQHIGEQVVPAVQDTINHVGQHAGPAIHGTVEHIVQHVGPAIEGTANHIGEHVVPAVHGTVGHIVQHVGPAIEGTAKHIGEHVVPAIHGTVVHVCGHVGPVIHGTILHINEHVIRHVMAKVEELRRLIETSLDLDVLMSRIAEKAAEITQMLQKTATGPLLDWIRKNPIMVSGIVVAIASVTILATPVGPVLALVGFGAAGVTAGSLATLLHKTIGNVAKGTLFATLQSAGAGGLMGRQALNTAVGVAGGLGLTAGLGTTILGIAKEGSTSDQ